MDHDSECGRQCGFPGCKAECDKASIACNGKHKCYKHMGDDFEPERRANVTVEVDGRYLKCQVALSATVEWDNMLNTARAADQLVTKAFFGGN